MTAEADQDLSATRAQPRRARALGRADEVRQRRVCAFGRSGPYQKATALTGLIVLLEKRTADPVLRMALAEPR
jgi:hypothetical protein